LKFSTFLAATKYAIESSDMPGPNLEVAEIISIVLASAKKIMTYIEYLKYLDS
jgi:hypothetical protein